MSLGDRGARLAGGPGQLRSDHRLLPEALGRRGPIPPHRAPGRSFLGPSCQAQSEPRDLFLFFFSQETSENPGETDPVVEKKDV